METSGERDSIELARSILAADFAPLGELVIEAEKALRAGTSRKQPGQ
jgi:hypothetical protein